MKPLPAFTGYVLETQMIPFFTKKYQLEREKQNKFLLVQMDFSRDLNVRSFKNRFSQSSTEFHSKLIDSKLRRSKAKHSVKAY